MSGVAVVKLCLLGMIVLPACQAAGDQRDGRRAAAADGPRAASFSPAGGGRASPVGSGQALPARYARAFACDFDRDPIAAATAAHGTPAGRAQRGVDLKTLKALGFARQGRDGDLESIGGKIASPAGLAILGLSAKSLELNGMIGDANAMYVTTFADGVTVAQVVQAARLTIDRASYDRYKIRHYSRQVGGSPNVTAYADDRGGKTAMLTCQVQSTPD